VRESFEKLEEGWFAEGRKLIAAPPGRKTEFMDECWRRAGEATDRWIADLERRNFTFPDARFAEAWDRFNHAAAMPFVQRFLPRRAPGPRAPRPRLASHRLSPYKPASLNHFPVLSYDLCCRRRQSGNWHRRIVRRRNCEDGFW
jgi:hypothetical protein